MKKLLALLVTCCLILSCGVFAAAATGKDIVLVFTNDVHCGVNDNLGYAGLAAYVKDLEQHGDEVILIDAGDAIQGATIGALSQGEYLVDIMNHIGYDLAVPGNHEFDYGMDQFFNLVEMADFPYVSCNLTDLRTGEPVLPSYLIKEAAGRKIAFVGICTPETIKSPAPAIFQNEKHEWIYGFKQDTTGDTLIDTVQASVDAARAEGVDYLIAVAHLGISEALEPYNTPTLITGTNGIDAVIDAHCHSIINEYIPNKDGEPVLLVQTGTKLESIGKIVICSDGSIDASLVSDYACRDAGTEAFINDIKAKFEPSLKEVIGRTDADLIIFDPISGKRIIRTTETNLGDLCADAYRAVSGADIAFVNGGRIRAGIPAGDITLGQIISVYPYGDMLTVMEATGQQILDALEWSAHGLPAEFRGFQHVSGASYEIHTYIESSAITDADDMFSGAAGEYRIRNVMIGGEPLDPEKTYTLAGNSYMLKQGGDGFTIFWDNNILQDEVMIDNQVLTTYICDTLDGVVGEEYADPYGQGRVIFVTEQP